MTGVPAPALPAEAGDAAALAMAYHARTKHTLKRYAAGPETLDWDMQPNPFREFAGCPRTPLELAAEGMATRFGEAIVPGGVPAAPLTLASVGLLLELSLGLAAWKELGPDRWAVRCNPSSGNLHPTEAYVIARGVAGLDDGVHHYVSRDHVLEHRCSDPAPAGTAPGLWIGLSSVHWREAWKYGERAFRYCQLDLGHALGALRYAAGAIGWRVRMVEGLDSAALAVLMGLDRAEDFAGAEAEEADVLLAIDAGLADGPPAAPPMPAGPWTGRANRLDAHPMYRWPVIEEVSIATRGLGLPADPPLAVAPPALPPPEQDARAADILLGRRSAQRFDARHHMPAETFFALLEALLPRASAPWDVWDYGPRLHPVLFVHRVEGLAPGLYALPRHPSALGDLKAALRADFAWAPVANAPAHVPLRRLVESDARGVMRTVSCHQAIAGDSSFALSLLAEFAPRVAADPWRYRQLHWEAGLIGHVLYLEAERAGLRGTGIGCFFDDALHELLGLSDERFQTLYHFTVGRALTDARISTLSAYPGRRPPPGASPSLSEDQTP